MGIAMSACRWCGDKIFWTGKGRERYIPLTAHGVDHREVCAGIGSWKKLVVRNQNHERAVEAYLASRARKAEEV